MANNPLEQKLECESRVMRLIMQDTHILSPLSPNIQSCFWSFDSGCLASFSHEDNFEYGERGPYHNSLKLFFQAGWGIWWFHPDTLIYGVGAVAMDITHTMGLYTCYSILPASTAYNCLRQPYSLSSRSSTVRRTCRTRPELVPELVGWNIQLAALVK